VARSPTGRKIAIIGRSYAVSELDGPLTLAAALCYLAAAAHSKSVHEQQQFASSFFADCDSGFKGVKIDANVEALLKEMIAKAGRTK